MNKFVPVLGLVVDRIQEAAAAAALDRDTVLDLGVDESAGRGSAVDQDLDTLLPG